MYCANIFFSSNNIPNTGLALFVCNAHQICEKSIYFIFLKSKKCFAAGVSGRIKNEIGKENICPPFLYFFGKHH